MNELREIYEKYGFLGLVVSVIIYLLWQKRDFFLSKDSKDAQKSEIVEQDPPCCEQRKTEIEQLKEKMKELEVEIKGHISESDRRVFDFGQFNAAQIEINKNVESTLRRTEETLNKIFDLMLKK